MTAEWPTEAREAVITALVIEWSETGVIPTRKWMAPVVDAVLAALAPHVQPRTDDWEWGLRRRVGHTDGPVDEALARRVQGYDGGTVVRRHPATAWEVAP